MEDKQNLKVLDCTLRDGGYYNQWDFDLDLARDYIQAVSSSGCKIIEIGFRFQSGNSFRGAFAYSSDDLIDLLDVPDDMQLAVMCNASEFLEPKARSGSAIKTLFNDKEHSRVDLVRVAVNFDMALQTAPILEDLKEKGYDVALNLMQASGKEDTVYSEMGRLLKNWGTISVLYFADSLGDMDPFEASRVAKNLLAGWEGELGFHPHNNKGQALANMMAAIETGVSWTDSTIMGMGRGAGNLPTEIFLAELIYSDKFDGNLEPLEKLLIRFNELHRRYQWGPNLYYFLAANWGIHPTFVQELLQDRRVSSKSMISVLGSLVSKNSKTYSKSTLEEAFNLDSDPEENTGTWEATGWLKGKAVLLVASGPNLEKYQEGIDLFIRSQKPFVISVNSNKVLEPALIDAMVSSNPASVLLESNQYEQLRCPLIAPASRLKKIKALKPNQINLFDYGVSIGGDGFELSDRRCEIKWDLTAAYALAVAAQAGAENIYLVGFDGLGDDKQGHEQMSEVFSIFKLQFPLVPITALTPSTYPVNHGSIYAR